MWRILLVTAAVAVSGGCFALNIAAAGLACGLDTSYCAEDRSASGEYRGRLFTGEMRHARNVDFVYRGESGATDRFTTDDQGRFCVLMPEEAIIPVIEPGPFRSSALRDKRFDNYPEDKARITDTAPVILVVPDSDRRNSRLQVHGGPTLGGLIHWHIPGDNADACQTSNARGPWYRSRDLNRRWQYLALIGVPLAAWMLLALSAPRAVRHRDRLRRAGVAVALGSGGLFVLLWMVSPGPLLGSDTRIVPNSAIAAERLVDGRRVEDLPPEPYSRAERALGRRESRRTAEFLYKCYRRTHDYRQCKVRTTVTHLLPGDRTRWVHVQVGSLAKDHFVVSAIYKTGNFRINGTGGYPTREQCLTNGAAQCPRGATKDD